jgi:hypothetical protein
MQSIVTEDSIRHQSLNSALKDSTNLDASGDSTSWNRARHPGLCALLQTSDCTALSSLERGKRCGLSHEDIQWSQPHQTYSGLSHIGHTVVSATSDIQWSQPRRHKVVSATEDIKWSQPQDVKVVSATEDTQWSQPQDVKVVLFVSTSPKTVPGSPTDLCSIRLYHHFDTIHLQSISAMIYRWTTQ